MNLKTTKGFTIVELLIVIVVIAILAAISIVAYTGIQNRARNSAAIELANQIAGKARAYNAILGTWPANVAGFTHTDAPEAALGGANVIDGTTSPTTGGSDQYRAGTQVIYNPTGPVIYYRLDTGTATMSL